MESVQLEEVDKPDTPCVHITKQNIPEAARLPPVTTPSGVTDARAYSSTGQLGQVLLLMGPEPQARTCLISGGPRHEQPLVHTHCCVGFHCVNASLSVYPLIQHLGAFRLGVIMNSPSMNTMHFLW